MAQWQPLNARWLGLSALVIGLDQLSKWAVTHLLGPYSLIKVAPFLNVVLAYNRGTAYSFLNNAPQWSRWVLSAIALLVSGYLLILILKSETDSRWSLASYSLILGGALGNLFDRLRIGYVVDFIDFHIGTWHFATFNIADAAITVGAVLLGVILLLKRE